MKKIILADQKLNQLVDDITASLMQIGQDRFENGAISGTDIAQFSKHPQVNQFILFRIYQDWNAQVSQIVHPYFDFTHSDVKEGLRRFLNILSGHILVRKEDFEPLVRQAVYNSLKLILNAEDSIGRFFFLNSESVAIDLVRKHAHYFSSYDFVIQAILKYHEKNEIPQVERRVFFEKFDRVIELWESKEGKSIAKYQRDLFLNLTGLELDGVVGKDQPAPEPVADETRRDHPADESEESKRTVIRIRSENIQRSEERKDNSHEHRTSQPSVPPLTSKDQGSEHESEGSKLPPWVQGEAKSRPAVTPAMPISKVEDRQRSLNEAFANREGRQSSLLERGIEKKESGSTPKIEMRVKANEPRPVEKEPEKEGPVTPPPTPRPLVGSNSDPSGDLGGKESRTLADRYRQQANPAGDDEGTKFIKAEQIPVHKQFQYVQKVFGGSSVKFKVVLDKMNKAESLDDVNEVLDKYVFNDPNVNRNDKVSKEFETMVKARFQH
ncbi:MAG: hypothetical protein RLZZ165_442 [Bacteroidota bacterium]